MKINAQNNRTDDSYEENYQYIVIEQQQVVVSRRHFVASKESQIQILHDDYQLIDKKLFYKSIQLKKLYLL